MLQSLSPINIDYAIILGGIQINYLLFVLTLLFVFGFWILTILSFTTCLFI
nr:MAG TPA: hypothetical protein [Caudoviricetes sp.]